MTRPVLARRVAPVAAPRSPWAIRLDRYEFVGAAVAIGIVGPVAWMALDQSPPLVITLARGSAAPVDRLGALKVRYQATYLRRCSGVGRREFVDFARHPMWTEPYAFRDGIGYDGRPVRLGVAQELPPISVTVPRDAAPGPATYQNTTRFTCNPLQKLLGGRWPWFSIEVRSPVIPFVISDAVATVIEPSTHLFAPLREDAADSADTPVVPRAPFEPSSAEPSPVERAASKGAASKGADR